MADARPLDWRLFRAAALVFLAAKLVLLAVAQPFMDETYYWLWGQHLALSYFDHPPLVGWTQGLASIFGWNRLALRVMVLATLAGDLALLMGFARQRGGDGWRALFWPSAALLGATPIFFGLTNLALPDHLLVFFTLLAVYAFQRFRAGFEAGAPRWRWLYLTALAIGLATLSKYTGALLAGGIGLAVLIDPRLRRLFRCPPFYLAIGLALVLQAPVLVWNLSHDMASFGFILGGRRSFGGVRFGGLGGYLGGIVLVLSPFLLWPLWRLLRASGDGLVFPRAVFWLSSLGFLAASLFTDILIHWNVVAYAAVLPFLAPYLRGRLAAYGHVVFGALVALVLAVNFCVYPVRGLVGSVDQASGWSYGWDEVGAGVAELAAAEGAGFIAATDYALASPLAFALRDRAVTSLAMRRDAFDDWFDAAAHAGDTAIIVADRWRPLPDAVAARFASVTEAAPVEVVRFGRLLARYRLYVGRGFAP